MYKNISEVRSCYKQGSLDKKKYIKDVFAFHQAVFEYKQFMIGTEIEEIKINSDGVSFKFKDSGFWLFSPQGEARVAPIEALNFYKYEAREVEIFDLLCSNHNCFIDVGANIGFYSIRSAVKNEKCKVYSFEPVPTFHSFLKRNIIANRLSDQIKPYDYALSNSSGVVDIYISPSNGTNASLLNVSGAEIFDNIKVDSITLDDFCKSEGISPDVIKCDVEGAELLVFSGATNVLKEKKPIVFTELLRKWSKPFGYHPNDLIDFFDTLGYVCFSLGEKSVNRILVVDDNTVETNYIFLNKYKHVNELKKLEGL